MTRTTRDLCQDCWQDENPTEYAPVATRYGPCAECGAEALVVRSAVAVHFESSPFPPYMRNAPLCVSCGVHDFLTGGACVEPFGHAPFHRLIDGTAFAICVEDAL